MKLSEMERRKGIYEVSPNEIVVMRYFIGDGPVRHPLLWVTADSEKDLRFIAVHKSSRATKETIKRELGEPTQGMPVGQISEDVFYLPPPEEIPREVAAAFAAYQLTGEWPNAKANA